MSRRVFVSVSGGVVDDVIVPTQTDGTWTVIDWDNIESDPARDLNSSTTKPRSTSERSILKITPSISHSSKTTELRGSNQF